VEILDWLDDHARYALSVTAHRRITGPIVLETFREAIDTHGIPASTLTDNGMVFTTRLSGGKGGRNAFENELHRLGITQINSNTNHLTTCGKVERFHQTLKKWLTRQPPATTIAELQIQLDTFVDEYNHRRPHRALTQHATPATAYAARPKADPATRTDTHNRVRTDRVDQAGAITLRTGGRLHHAAATSAAGANASRSKHSSEVIWSRVSWYARSRQVVASSSCVVFMASSSVSRSRLERPASFGMRRRAQDVRNAGTHGLVTLHLDVADVQSTPTMQAISLALSTAAWGDWHPTVPQGMVGLSFTARDGHRYALVPARDYPNRSIARSALPTTLEWTGPNP
jgi:hypothetical protein